MFTFTFWKQSRPTRGIVTTAGGPLYFLNAYLNFRLLREKGCDLPFEWFYLGAEMTPAMLGEARKIPNLRLINLGGKSKNNAKDKGGWQSKIEAIVQSRFDEVLFLDADNFPRRDPEYMFHEPLYVKYGAVFWPDMWKWSADGNPHVGYAAGKLELDDRFGVTLPEQQIESGQMMFCKRKCGKALDAVRTLNRNSADTYKVVFGDKDTFLIGFLQTHTDFLINPYPCERFRGGLYQKDLHGDQLFSHLTGAKFQWHARALVTNVEVPGVSQAIHLTHELRGLPVCMH